MTSISIAARRMLNSLRSSGPLWTASLVLDRVGLRTQGLWPDQFVSAQDLSKQIAAILRGFGMLDDHVSITTEYLMYADLHGIDSHGCAMLSQYHQAFQNGLLEKTPQIQVIRETETTGLIDGGGGLGHVPADTAMKMAIEKCRMSGTAIVVVRNSGHFGAAGAYASLAAKSGFIGMAMTNTGIPAVVPTYGADAKLGTNPVAFAAPVSHNRPFLFDMATSTVPLGKLMVAHRNGRSIPVGWALDADGMPLTNARLAVQYRRLTPLGSNPDMSSHKGYGLATMVEILTSLLSGTCSSQTEPRTGHFFLALNPNLFRENGEFENDLDALMGSLRNCRPLHAEQPVLVAGDPEYAAYAERSSSGIPLSRSVIEDLRAICRSIGVPFDLQTQSKSV